MLSLQTRDGDKGLDNAPGSTWGTRCVLGLEATGGEEYKSPNLETLDGGGTEYG